MKNKIKYNIFRLRKNFNIINWLKSATEKSYESFTAYLNNRNILPPSREYFDNALSFYNSLFNNKCNTTEEPVAEEPIAEQPVAEEPIAEQPVAEEQVVEQPVAEEPVAEQPVAEQPVVEQPVVEEPKKRRRRRTKKVQSEN